MPAAKPADKIDLFKLHKDEYASPKKPKIIETKPAQYLSISGTGSPQDAAFETAMEALYGCAYKLKFQSKSEGRDYTVCKLEGFWSGWNTDLLPNEQDKSNWKWQLIIRTPDFITSEHLKATQQLLLEKGKDPACKKVKLVQLHEGKCVQMLHIGPYDQEMQTIETMHAHAAEQNLKPHGKHHEIYLSDPRKVEPAKLKTILRHPVK